MAFKRIVVIVVGLFIVSIVMAGDVHPSDITEPAFQETKSWNKLGQSLKDAYLDAVGAGDLSRRLELFVRVDVPFDAGDRSFLEDHGFVYRTHAGAIVRGHVAAKDLRSVASLPFIRSVNLAVP